MAAIPTRRSLLSRLNDLGDDRSWRDFFDTYWKLIYGVSRKAGLSDAEAQDVVQEVVLGVAKKIKDLKYDASLGSFKGWLLNMTRWRILDQIEDRQPASRRKNPATEDEERRTATVDRIPDPKSLDLAAVWEHEWERNLIDAAMARVKKKVSAKQYQIFHCYVVKEWPVARVMKTLDVSRGQVYLAKHRVSPLVRKEIELLKDKLV